MTTQKKMDILEDIVLKIATYGPKAIYVDITERLTSYKSIFDSIRRVCGFPVPGAQLIQYIRARSSYDKSGSESYNDFYWRLRDEKIASLMKVESGVRFKGRPLDRDEEITPMLENQVVCDWLYGIGGIKLVNHIGQEYAKELETTSIFDLQEIIGHQEVMKAIIDRMETDEVAKLNRAQSYGNAGKQREKSFQGKKTSSSSYEKRWCFICEELKNRKAETHDTKNCFLREKNKKKLKTSK